MLVGDNATTESVHVPRMSGPKSSVNTDAVAPIGARRVNDPPPERDNTTEYDATVRFTVVPWWAIATTTRGVVRTPTLIEHANCGSGNALLATSKVVARRPRIAGVGQPTVAAGTVVVVVVVAATTAATVITMVPVAKLVPSVAVTV